MQNDRQICSGDCKKEKNLTEFYASSSPFHSRTGKLHVCKQCIWDRVNNQNENIDLIKDTLRMLDKPYLGGLWQTSIQESEKANKDIFKTYMKNLGMRQYRELMWKDSDSIKSNHYENEKDSETSNNEELVKKWGRGNSDSDLEYLENFFFEYSHNYATDTPVQINLYKNIGKVHLQAEKALANSNIKEFKDLMELSSKLHNDGNIKPIQSTGANDDKGLSTYGLWIKTVEQEEPCEHFESKPIYEDFDKLKKYINDWFVRPFKNIFNISKDFNVRDDD
ncbi:hypothetical protein [Metabacillus arenae]|uniref:Uncharacterized protein n=1 Tax=Metabacillus arenae TaxID=2771434 RepID=A0A926RWI6_9BACI|nr:hypothetical protein [Metabacillus arenae]MBD1379202.1 hypothetical protein [Metabacillus arenae]